MKIILLSDAAIRLEPTDAAMTIEALEPDQQYSPFHMLASSLAYCTFSVMYSWAAQTDARADDLVIEVRWVFSDDEPRRVSELHMSYDWPSLPARKREAARRVAQLCTIHETLLRPVTITTEPMGSDRPATADDMEAAGHIPASNGRQ